MTRASNPLDPQASATALDGARAPVAGVPDPTALEAEVQARLRAEAALRISEGKLRRLYESDILGIVLSDTEGAVHDANDAFLALVGYTREDLNAGRVRWTEMTPPEYGASTRHVLAQLRARGVADLWEKEYVRKDGTRVPVALGAALLPGSEKDCICYVLDLSARRHAEQALARLNAGLELRVEEAQSTLRALGEHLEHVREEERTHLAREIHDVLGQELTGLKLDASWLARRLDERAEPALGEVRARVAQMLAQVDGAITLVRRLATRLRPGVLDDLGLAAALEWQAQEFSARSDLEVSLEVAHDGQGIDDARATALFRIFQELLGNVARHAEARHVRASLRAEPGAIVLEVQDDGRGITPAQACDPRSLGLLGMRERARLFGGEVSLEGAPGRGTRARVRIPQPGSGGEAA